LALLLVHYFGVPADAAAARKWCDERGMALIEDCAQSFLSTVNGAPIGSSGDFAVYSFRKQLPVASGAALAVNGRRAPQDSEALKEVPLTRARRRAPVSPSTVLRDPQDGGSGRRRRERGGRAGLIPALREVAAWAVFASGSGRLRRWLAPSLSDERGLRAAAPGRASGADWVTRRVIARLSKKFDEIAERRRSNYLLLQRELSGLPRVKPVFRALIEGAVPWGCPLRVEGGQPARDELLAVLLHEGIGAWPWPDLPAEVTEAEHPEAWRLAHETVVLPVHQGLNAAQVEYVADTVSGWALS
jgi:dTDP-4-amino-4,6-dideoxygalactose transaminase